jgi:hypothetical protein
MRRATRLHRILDQIDVAIREPEPHVNLRVLPVKIVEGGQQQRTGERARRIDADRAGRIFALVRQ